MLPAFLLPDIFTYSNVSKCSGVVAGVRAFCYAERAARASRAVSTGLRRFAMRHYATPNASYALLTCLTANAFATILPHAAFGRCGALSQAC